MFILKNNRNWLSIQDNMRCMIDICVKTDQFRFSGVKVNLVFIRVGVKNSTCTWYLYLSTYLSVLDVLEYLVYGNVKVLVLVLVLDQKVLGTYK